MKFKKISTRMLCLILPVIIVAMIVLTLVSSISSKSIIESQMQDRMTAELNAQNNLIRKELQNVSDAAEGFSINVGTTYRSTADINRYIDVMQSNVKENDTILGMGLWFEKYAFNGQEMVGPYVSKDGDNIFTTWEYSTKEYDYWNQEYYTNAKSKTDMTASFTNPYYDESSGETMSSCSVPMFDSSTGSFIGCVTAPVKLSTAQDIVASIQIGKAGNAFMVDSDGAFIYNPFSEEKSKDGTLITSENSELSAIGSDIMANDSGSSTYKYDGTAYNVYYSTIPETGWKLIIQIPSSELNEPINSLILKLVAVCAVALILTAVVILLIVRSLAANINAVKRFSGLLAEGNFTIDNIPVTSQDELGNMSEALNTMYDSNRSIIQQISDHAHELDSSARSLKSSSDQLSVEFETIKNYMAEVNEATMSSSAATEEVNASTEGVKNSVKTLTDETGKGSKMAVALKETAENVKANSEASYDNILKLAEQFENELQKSIEDAKV
ncbi:MAG: methyl-accepting chemotaxis protein, partial [Clostridia bacterium]|nr:methyl-accepting chemotaxis protein [Clostridia bacterium]